jgi:hypothetical protein
MKHFTFAMSFAAMLMAPAIMLANETPGQMTPQIACGDWTFNCAKVDNGYKITSVATAGKDNELDFSNNTAIVAIAADAFSGNTTLTSVVLPSSFTTADLAEGSLLFSGCTSLTNIAVADNTGFTTDRGALYTVDAEGNKTALVAYPEGRLFTELFRIKASNGNYAYASPSVNDHKVNHVVSDWNVKFASLAGCSLNSLVRFALNADGTVKIEHVNSLLSGGQDTDDSLYFGVSLGQSVVCNPNSSTLSTYTYSLSAKGTELVPSFSAVYGGGTKYLGYSDDSMKYLSTDQKNLSLEVATSIDIQLNSAGMALVQLPIDLMVPASGVGVYTVSAVDKTTGEMTLDRMAANGVIVEHNSVLLHGTANQMVTLNFPTDKQWEELLKPISESSVFNVYSTYFQHYYLSYLKGAANRGTTYENVFVLEGNTFVFKESYTQEQDNVGVIDFYIIENNIDVTNIPTYTITLADEVEDNDGDSDDEVSDKVTDGEDKVEPDNSNNSGSETAISEIVAETATDAAIYDINGRKVNGALRSGLYINSNGQKFIVK